MDWLNDTRYASNLSWRPHGVALPLRPTVQFVATDVTDVDRTSDALANSL